MPLVLHIEDDDSDARLVARSLQRAGRAARMERAVDGREGLSLLDAIAKGAHDTPVLVLLDLKLPYASGLQILAHARALQVLDPVPIVILTSSDVEEDRNRCADLGCTDYVVKPIDYHEFQAALQGIWDRYVPDCP